MAKLAKSTVHYGPGMPNSRCDICVHWRPPYACSIVEGHIRPGDWCNRFEKKPRPPARHDHPHAKAA